MNSEYYATFDNDKRRWSIRKRSSVEGAADTVIAENVASAHWAEIIAELLNSLEFAPLPKQPWKVIGPE